MIKDNSEQDVRPVLQFVKTRENCQTHTLQNNKVQLQGQRGRGTLNLFSFTRNAFAYTLLENCNWLAQFKDFCIKENENMSALFASKKFFSA